MHQLVIKEGSVLLMHGVTMNFLTGTITKKKTMYINHTAIIVNNYTTQESAGDIVTLHQNPKNKIRQ